MLKMMMEILCFKVGDHVKISKYKSIFAKTNPNWLKEVIAIEKIRNTVPWAHIIEYPNG